MRIVLRLSSPSHIIMSGSHTQAGCEKQATCTCLIDHPHRTILQHLSHIPGRSGAATPVVVNKDPYPFVDGSSE